MQFTGLKDKNNIEIYEGDYYLHQYHDGYKVMYEIYWYNGGFMYGIKKEQIGWYCYQSWGDSIEILGNIYQSPEVIDNQKVTNQ